MGWSPLGLRDACLPRLPVAAGCRHRPVARSGRPSERPSGGAADRPSDGPIGGWGRRSGGGSLGGHRSRDRLHSDPQGRRRPDSRLEDSSDRQGTNRHGARRRRHRRAARRVRRLEQRRDDDVGRRCDARRAAPRRRRHRPRARRRAGRGRARPSTPPTSTEAGGGTAATADWAAPNGDWSNTRDVAGLRHRQGHRQRPAAGLVGADQGHRLVRLLRVDADHPRRRRLHAGPRLERAGHRRGQRQGAVDARRSTRPRSGRTASRSPTGASTARPPTRPSRSTRRPATSCGWSS